MNSLLSQAKFVLIAISVAFLCMDWADADAKPPKPATSKQKKVWENKWTDQVGVSLEYSFDSSGPDAWESK